MNSQFRIALEKNIKEHGKYIHPNQEWFFHLGTLLKRSGMEQIAAESESVQYSFQIGMNSSRETLLFVIPMIHKAYNTSIDSFSLPSEYFSVTHFQNNLMPLLPLELYEKLPKFLKDFLKLYSEDRDKDCVLLTLLTVLSSCFPHLYGVYDGRIVSPNLFLFISAPASAGKGVIQSVRKLSNAIQKTLNDDYEKALELYEQEMNAYNDNKEGKPPVKPKRKLFYIPANNSSSKILDVMSNNKGFGVIFETEADTLVQALKNDWGNFSDTLRKSYQNESIEMQRKINDEYISLERSYLSMVLSGTPNQISNLLNNIENGFYSRFLFYNFPLTLNWRNVYEFKESLPDVVIEEMSLKLNSYLLKCAQEFGISFLAESPIVDFKFNSYQIESITQYFGSKEKQYYDCYGGDLVANVRRMGLASFRIAMILTALRQFESDQFDRTLVCNNDDCFIAITIAEFLLKHAGTVYDGICNWQTTKSDKQHNIYLFYDALPDNFTTSIFKEIADQLGVKHKTAEYRIQKFIDDGILLRTGQGAYSKVEKD